MIKCPECGRDVSSLAVSCPSCGCPIKTEPNPKKCHYYCPICGLTVFPHNDICPRCKNYITPIRSMHESGYYGEKALQLYDDKKQWRKVLIDEEVSHNPQYNPNTTVHNAVEEHQRRIDKIFAPKTDENTLKCPICGSTNVTKISTVNRAVSIGLLGLASSKIGKQYECKKCKHKW